MKLIKLLLTPPLRLFGIVYLVIGLTINSESILAGKFPATETFYVSITLCLLYVIVSLIDFGAKPNYLIQVIIGFLPIIFIVLMMMFFVGKSH